MPDDLAIDEMSRRNVHRRDESVSSDPAPLPAEGASRIGVVVIGRNEGSRLHRCLRSVVGRGFPVVYVDSGSIDGSASFARSTGVDVVELDAARPFSAARARNEGFERLLTLDPRLKFVQFVDGDCEMARGWFAQGLAALCAHPRTVAVFGRVRERYPERSVYNRVCDLDWDRPLGEAPSCGGIALWRADALRAVGGFDANLIAGEEPELCFRLRQRGGKILRIAPEMTLHDAEIVRFGQWWRRATRTGHAYAEGAALHRANPGRHAAHELHSIVCWGILLPLLAVAVSWWTHGMSLLLLVVACLVLWSRIYRFQRRRGRCRRDAALVAAFDALAKLPQAQGVLWYWMNRSRRRRTSLIEYKEACAR